MASDATLAHGATVAGGTTQAPHTILAPHVTVALRADNKEKPDEANGLEKVPVEKIVSAIGAVTRRTPTRINSFKYFVRELVSLPEPRNRAWQKKQLEKIVRRIREHSIGRANYTVGDLAEDVKHACARETVPFDNDLFSELTGY